MVNVDRWMVRTCGEGRGELCDTLDGVAIPTLIWLPHHDKRDDLI